MTSTDRIALADGVEAKGSFGADGRPGSSTDVDHADVIALFGHNMAALGHLRPLAPGP